MPDDRELIYLLACALAMGGFAAHALGCRLGPACATAGFMLAVIATFVSGREGVGLLAVAAMLAGAVAWLGTRLRVRD